MKKTIRILVALTVVFVLCLALASCGHDSHTATGDWLFDDTHHWHACENDECEDAGDKAEHTYDNACDASCNVCGAERTVGAHTYDNACDTKCNVCDAERTVGAHAYDNACDTTCNTCGAIRTITHAHGTTLTAGDTTHYYLCSVCGDKKDEAAHVFDKTVASNEYLKAEATATTKAQYYKSCVCGAKSATEYFETDKTAGTLANIQDLSKTYDKVELANPTYETNSDGAVTIEWYQGDTKLDSKPVNAGTYKVKVIIAESATYTGVSLEKEFTIAKKVLSDLSVDLTYDGTNSFEVPLGAANGILADDVADGIKVCITFANKNVGAAVTGAGLDADDGNNFANYELDLTTCTASIVKKPLNRLDIEFTYDGGNIPGSFDLTAADGVIAGDDIWLYGDGWQGYDVAYDEYTLTDDLSDYDYDEGVELRGADKGNYKFTYDTDGSVGKVTVMPYILDFTGEYVKDADGTHYFTFTQDVTWSHGGTDTVTVKIALVDLEAYWITAPGVYTQENAQIGDESFYIGGVECEGFELDEDYYADEFKVTVLSTDDLVMQVTNKYKIEEDFIIVVEIKQGAVKVGDSIVLSDTPAKVYDVLTIEKLNKPLEFATVGDEVGLYVSNMTDLAEVPGASFLYEKDNVPEMATEFLADVYLRTSAEGGRNTPIFSGYKPSLVGLGASQEVELTIMDVYNSDNDTMLTLGGTARVKVTLTTPLPACLLETTEFSLLEGSKHVGNVDNVDLIPYDSFAKALVVDCDTEHSETMQVYVGQKVYVKMKLHEIDTQEEVDAVLSALYIKATTGSAATFTWESYKNNTTTAEQTVTTPTAEVSMLDLTCWEDGDYFYYVITCVTAGEISIIVE